jgi:hypothetical protein
MYNDYDVVRFNKKLYFFGEYIEDDLCILINLDYTENYSWYYLKTLEFVMSYEKYKLDKVLSKFESRDDAFGLMFGWEKGFWLINYIFS